MEKTISLSYTITGTEILLAILVVILVLSIFNLGPFGKKRKKVKKKINNRDELMAEVAMGLNIINELEILFSINNLDKKYLNKSIMRLKDIFMHYDSQCGLRLLKDLYRYRKNEELFRRTISLLEAELKKV